MTSRILFLTLGGTISTLPTKAGLMPAAGGEALCALVPGLSELAAIRVENLSLLASASLDLGLILTLRDRIAAADDADGVVVTMGTDTMEEVAFGLNLVLDNKIPVIITGAMRAPSLAGSDFAANITSAVRAALCRELCGSGVLVVMNDEIHAAAYVAKTHTSRLAAFASPGFGPLAEVAENQVRLHAQYYRRAPALEVAGEVPPVALIKAALGDDGRLLDAVSSLGYRGVVIEAMGGGHVRADWVPRLAKLAKVMPVVFASRTGSGQVLRATYGYPGSERDLIAAGLTPAAALPGLKARLLLAFSLMNGDDRQKIAERFAGYDK